MRTTALVLLMLSFSLVCLGAAMLCCKVHQELSSDAAAIVNMVGPWLLCLGAGGTYCSWRDKP